FDERDLSSVKLLVMGGAASPPALVEEARRRFDAGYSIRWSSTESGGVGTATAPDAPDNEALHTVGRPRPGMGLQVRGDDGSVLPAGEVGEVWLRS
ncbi:MAG: AMP-binding protein, partial [Acidimicrobiales bacterium]|nr:AMP-binding protein [Acidimicrobiales bacterium]